ncbi:MAG: ABC transporter substrate-binding protein [Sulfurospirillaceae bacterium]|nr:ABC transporter substrate-binding protein [Sulfurospirillaceae bacterium]
MSHTLFAQTIVDMKGREVTLPDTIQKVFATSPYGSYILYAIDPSLLSGWVIRVAEKNKPFLDKRTWDLPVVGSMSGQGQTSNIENVFVSKPDFLLMWSTSTISPIGNLNQKLEQFHLPYVYAIAESMEDYPKVFTFLGKVLHQESRATQLSQRTQTILDDVKKAVSLVPPEKRPKVYYAEGPDGLSTECDDSIHVEVLKILGDVNVHRCHTSNHKGFEKMTMEQVLVYNPDVIITQEEALIDTLKENASWKNITAVQKNQVYLIPTLPFNWFDRPPSFMRFLGLQWLANLLYPQEYPIDIRHETEDFYALFMGVSLDSHQLNLILSPKSLAPKE